MIPEIKATFHKGQDGSQPYSQVDIDLVKIEPIKEIFDGRMQEEIVDKLIAALSEQVGEDRAERGTLTTVNMVGVTSPHIRRYRLYASPF